MSKFDTRGSQPLAQLVKAHGTRGAVRLRWRFDVSELHAWPRVANLRHHRRGERLLTLGPLRAVGGADMLAETSGAFTREEADAWRGADVFVTEDVVPPAADGEVYLFHLIGRRAVHPDGFVLGTIVASYDYGAGAVLGLASTEGGPEDLLLPLAVAHVGDVSDATNSVVINVAKDVLGRAE